MIKPVITEEIMQTLLPILGWSLRLGRLTATTLQKTKLKLKHTFEKFASSNMYNLQALISAVSASLRPA